MGYNTKQRAEILDCLQKNKNKHLTADMIYSILTNEGVSVGRTTVYRHLDKLYADGKVRKYAAGDGGSACFQLADSNGCKMHYHLKCTECGRLFHAECDFLNGLSEHILKEHNFYVDGEKTVLYGICGDCRGEEKK